MSEYSLVRGGSIMRRRLCRDCRRPVHEIGHYYCVEDAVGQRAVAKRRLPMPILPGTTARPPPALRRFQGNASRGPRFLGRQGAHAAAPWTEYVQARQGL